MARRLSQRADLALLARGRILRRSGARRLHAFGRRGRTLLRRWRFSSAKVQASCRRRKSSRTKSGLWRPRRFCSTHCCRSAASSITIGAVAELMEPAQAPSEASIAGMTLLAGGGVVVRDFDDELALALRAARRFGHRQTFAGQSFWWTIGGEGFSPTALIETGLPIPERFAEMLTGSFDRSAAAFRSWSASYPVPRRLHDVKRQPRRHGTRN